MAPPTAPQSPPQTKKDKVARLFAAGRFADVERLARSMTAAYPDDAFGWKALGAALQQTGRSMDALECTQRAASLSPRDAEIHKNVGTAFASLERFEEAVTSYRAAIALRSDYPEAYDNLGYVLVQLGRMEEAESAYRRAIAGNPRLAESYRNLGSLTKYSEDDPRLALMEQLYREGQLPESDHVHICFALGKACEDLNRVDDAFAYYAEGNRLRKRQLGYSPDQDRRLFAAIRATFSPSGPPRPSPSASHSEPRPIFIVGMPRSGTTLVEQILSSHSQVFGAGEQQAMALALRDEFNPDERGYQFDRDADTLARIRRRYRATLQRLDPGTPAVTDKMPTNFLWVGYILEAMPEAKVVNMVRDPMAVCWSNYTRYYSGNGLGFTYDLEDMAGYSRMYEELMAFWHQRYPGRIHDLHYERLTENQETETRALLDYCGLPWEEGCLDFHENERVVHTASVVQVRKKLYRGSSEAWKKFEKHLRPLSDALRISTPEVHDGERSSATALDKKTVEQLVAAGRYADSERLARDMTTKYPNDAYGWKAWGATLQQAGRSADALEPMQRAAKLAPWDAEAHGNLGNALACLWRLEEAIAAYHQAIELNPEYPKVYLGLGDALKELGRPDEAVAAYHKAIALKPGYPEAYNNLGIVLMELGRLEDAKSAYRMAVAGNPELGMIYWNLGLLAQYTEDDPQFATMKRLHRQRQLPESHHIYLCFALGKACEDMERVDDAFSYYAEGNRLRKQQLGYSLDRDRWLFGAIRSAFSQAPPVTLPSATHSGPRPIFIVGMPRSGTTLVEQILSSHSRVFGAGECAAMRDAIWAQFSQDGKITDFAVSKNALEGVRSHYLTALREINDEAPVITDKMPASFLWTGYMLEAFPGARVVNLVRDPVAVCWSIFKHPFASGINLGFAYDLADLAGYFELYRQLMAFWRQRYLGRIYDLCYEALTENQEEETRALLEYCGLDWEAQCLDFHENQRAIRTASALQVRRKMYQGSSEAWKNYAKHLQPLIDAVGAFNRLG